MMSWSMVIMGSSSCICDIFKIRAYTRSVCSSFLALFQGVVCGVLLEVDLDAAGSQDLVACSNGCSTVLQEMLLIFINGHLVERGTVKSHANAVSDDNAGQEELVEDSRVDSAEGAAVGSLLGLVGFDPAGADVAPGKEEDCLLEALF